MKLKVIAGLIGGTIPSVIALVNRFSKAIEVLLPVNPRLENQALALAIIGTLCAVLTTIARCYWGLDDEKRRRRLGNLAVVWLTIFIAAFAAYWLILAYLPGGPAYNLLQLLAYGAALAAMAVWITLVILLMASRAKSQNEDGC